MSKVAVVQAAPVLFDADKTIDKVGELVAEAAGEGAELILFPEAFIPAYPRGLSFGTVVGSRTVDGRKTWRRYWENSIAIPGPSTEKLASFAKENKVILVIGVIEKDTHSEGTLYCTLVYFDASGKLLGKHRKLKPTAAERIIWGEGDGSDLNVYQTPIGKIGGLICWENYMPLARMALYKQGVQLYLAPTADQRDSWQDSMRHIACESRAYILASNQYVTKEMYPSDLEGIADLDDQPEVMSRGGSVIIDPLGRPIAGPLFDEEGILYAEIDLGTVAESKLDFDVVGHYARDDVFEFGLKSK